MTWEKAEGYLIFVLFFDCIIMMSKTKKEAVVGNHSACSRGVCDTVIRKTEVCNKVLQDLIFCGSWVLIPFQEN